MSELKDQNRRGYSKYDEMSTEALEQILRLDFQASEDSESDINAILYISEVIAKRKGLSAGNDADAAWEQFKTKYLPYADGRSLYDFDDGVDNDTRAATKALPEHPDKAHSHSRHHRTRRLLRLRRLITVAAVLAACLFGGIMAAQAAGIDVLGAIGRWTDETFHFVILGSGESSAHEVDMEYYDVVESTLNEWGANEDLFPTWQPEGFVAQMPRITNDSNSDALNMRFIGNDRFYSVRALHFYAMIDSSGMFEKDSSPVEEYVHNGNLFYILSNVDSVTATCYNEEFMTTISGTLTIDEIKAIIDSIGGE